MFHSKNYSNSDQFIKKLIKQIALASDKLTTVNQVFAKVDFLLSSLVEKTLPKSIEMNGDELNLLYTSLKQASEVVQFNIVYEFKIFK